MHNERNEKPALLVHTEIFKQARNNVPKAIKHTKASHFYAKLEDAALDSKKIFFLLSTLLNRWDRSDSLPDRICQETAKSFSPILSKKTLRRQEFNDDPFNMTENLLPVFLPLTCSLVFMLSPKIKSRNSLVSQSQ